jgi:serine protease
MLLSDSDSFQREWAGLAWSRKGHIMKASRLANRFACAILSVAVALSGLLVAAPPALGAPSPLPEKAAFVEVGPPGSYAEGRIVVSFDRGDDRAARADSLAGAIAALSKKEGVSGTIKGGRGTTIEQSDGAIVALVRFPKDVSVADAIAVALKDPEVRYAEPDYFCTLDDSGQDTEGADELSAMSITNDPMLQNNQQWWHNADKIGSITARDQAKSNGAVTVAVIDSGLRLDHQDLAANVLSSYAFSFIMDDNGVVEYVGSLTPSFGKGGDGSQIEHGTKVSGIVAATANNELGGAGVSYNARILPVNIFPSNIDLASNFSVAYAINYLAPLREAGAVPSLKVANMSFGSGFPTTYVHEAVQRLRAAGVLPVAAAGNTGGSAAHYPSD